MLSNLRFVKQNGVDKQRAKHSILTEAIETTLAVIRLLTEEVAEKVSGRSLKEEFSLKKIYTRHGYKPNLKPARVLQVTA